MPNGSYKGKADAQCPFYKFDVGQQKRRIACEGIVDDSTLELRFTRKKDFDTQLVVFCCEHYKRCEVYRMIMEAKYNEEE